MGAEGKYDLKLVNCDNLPLLEAGCSTSNASALPTSTKKYEMKSNVLVNRKSSSTPSLPEATEHLNANSVASTEQAASADNLTWKQAAETIAENVLSDIVSSNSDEKSNNNQPDCSSGTHALRELENHHDLSLINHAQNAIATTSDLATITENYTLASSAFIRSSMAHADDKLTNIEANNKMNSNNAVNSISKTLLGSLRGVAPSRVTQISSEALDVIDKMREGMMRNNANNIMSSEILQIPANAHLVSSAPVKLPSSQKHLSASSSSDNEKHRNKMKPIHGLKQSKRQIVAVDESCSYPLLPPSSVASIASASASTKRDTEPTNTARNSVTVSPIVIESMTSSSSPLSTITVNSNTHAVSATTISNMTAMNPHSNYGTRSHDQDENQPANANSCDDVVLSNPMSVSVPNLTTGAENTNQIVPVSPPGGLLETFAALARRRTSGNSFHTNNQVINSSSNANASQQQTSFFPRGPNSVSSLVKMALSSNFHTGLLSTAQSYPSLTSSSATSTSNNILNSSSGASAITGHASANINPTLTMSLTSSSDSEQVSFEDFLDSCRGPTLLGDLEDDEIDEDDDENEDDYEEVGVSNKQSEIYPLAYK